jgi:ABC-2 type transport system permease protein
MTALVRAELRKLLTTRGTYVLVAAVVAVSVLAVAGAANQSPESFRQPLGGQQFAFFSGLLGRVLLLVLGIRAMTDEFRYGTLTPSLLVSPDRRRLLAAKTVAVALVCLAAAVLAQAALLGSAAWLFAAERVPLQVGAADVQMMAGFVWGGMLWGAVGVAVGALVGAQLPALVAGFLWLMIVEDMLTRRLDDLAAFLPGQAGLLAALGPTDRLQVLGGLTLRAWAPVLALGGAVLMRRRDVTA